MDKDQRGLAQVKQEGWAYCIDCNAEAPPGEDLVHEYWCKPPTKPSRWRLRSEIPWHLYLFWTAIGFFWGWVVFGIGG